MITATATDIKTDFDRDGFVVFDRPLVPAHLIAAATAGMDMVMRGENDTGRADCGSYGPRDVSGQLVKIENPQFASQAIRDLIRHPAIGEMAAAAAGATKVQAWWVQLLYKPSTTSETTITDIGWHQDRSYWGEWEEGSELFTAWVALTDVDESCGPMIFARGSNNWKGAAGGNFFSDGLESARLTVKVPEGETWEEVQALMPAGGFSLHDELTFHGSGPNLSGRPRRNFAIHMRTQNSRPRSDQKTGLVSFIDDYSLCPVIYGTAPML